MVCFVLVLCALCASCASASLNYDDAAKKLKIARSVINVDKFNLAIYSNALFNNYHGGEIHIYLDGDGSPWQRNGLLISDDPTPRQYLVLQLMSLDSAPSILIGRPCYHGFSHDSNCYPLLWTHQRYSETILSAISAAIDTLLKNKEMPKAVFIGYSGGGTLAVLLAEKIPQTRAIITLAGNFDLATWAKLHHYDQLDGSIDPIARPPLDKHIIQMHYAGRLDNNIPLDLTQSYLSKKNRGEIIILENADHFTGWNQYWPNILSEINNRLLVTQ